MNCRLWTFEWEGSLLQASLGWAVRTDCTDLALLHPLELARMNSFSSEVRRNGFCLGRVAAKRSLSSWISAAQCAQTPIDSGAFGQPVLTAPWEVSLSHSDTFAVAVASPIGFPMGIDIESTSEEPSRLRALEGQSTAEEQAKGADCYSDRTELLHGLWSAKEALSKVLRTGLGTSFTVLEVTQFAKAGEIRTLGFRHFFQYSVIQRTISGKIVSLAVPSQGKADWEAAFAPLVEALR